MVFDVDRGLRDLRQSGTYTTLHLVLRDLILETRLHLSLALFRFSDGFKPFHGDKFTRNFFRARVQRWDRRLGVFLRTSTYLLSLGVGDGGYPSRKINFHFWILPAEAPALSW